jgi:hypothetical protein
VRHLAASAIVLLAGSSCFDLSVPELVSDAGPSVSFLTPADGGIISLSTFVELQVVSLNGVAAVSLLCSVDGGYAGLQTWQSEPTFEATVDFSSCAQGQNVLNVGTEQLIPLELDAVAIDNNGNLGAQTLDVSLDVSAPVLTIQAPARVGPNSTLTLSLQSNRPLAGPPAVEVQGTPAVVTGDPAGLNFVATLSPTPSLGAAGYDGGPDASIPIDVLEAVEVPLPISIDAHDRQNGNLTHVSYQVLLSRLLWQKAVPGTLSGSTDLGPCSGAPTAAASEVGVQLPLMTGGYWTAGLPSCVAGVMAAADGTFIGTSPAFEDAGVTLLGFDNSGHAVYFDGSTAWFVDTGTNAVSQLVAGADGFAPFASTVGGPSLLPVGPDSVCILQPVTDAGVCSTNALCLSVGAVTPSSTLVTDTAAINSSFQASNGDLALWGAASCQCAFNQCPSGTDVAIGTPLSSSVLLVTSALAGSPVATFEPLQSGGFFVQYDSVEGLSTFGEVNSVATVSSPWSPSANATAFASFPDGRLVTQRYDFGFTVFEAWDPSGSATPVASSRIAGLLGTTSVTVSTANVIATLVNTDPLGNTPAPAVLVMDHGLNPLWLYRYATPSTSLQLVTDPAGTLLYLVDPVAQQVTAMPL